MTKPKKQPEKKTEPDTQEPDPLPATGTDRFPSDNQPTGSKPKRKRKKSKDELLVLVESQEYRKKLASKIFQCETLNQEEQTVFNALILSSLNMSRGTFF